VSCGHRLLRMRSETDDVGSMPSANARGGLRRHT
jgi:hypothetical protein